ncbi:MAG: RtcB family protein [Xanthomonadales bacterium]|nr:RtcB family protein [Xanthomonadales bacterium]
MNINEFRQIDDHCWAIDPSGSMRAPAMIHASRELIEAMDDKVREQLVNVATLPGIVGAAHAMPDAHWGYGFPIGGVAAFDADAGGVISAGGVGFDISCGVRSHRTGLRRSDIEARQKKLANALARHIPAGVGSRGDIRLGRKRMDAMLAGGAAWALSEGYGEARDLEFIEDRGTAPDARPGCVSDRARKRQADEMGTLGSGNHYLEIQEVDAVHDREAAAAFGLVEGECVVTIHCGSRGLGHQIGTEFLRDMAVSAGEHGIALPDRELACAPIRSETGQAYIGAMRSAINCALANRQIIGHLMREVLRRFWPGLELPLIYDVSHNTCMPEQHPAARPGKRLWVHRKGATRAFGPGDESLPGSYRATGQPVLIGGSMGTESWILAGMASSEEAAFSSACHGAGRRMSRNQARKRWQGRQVIDKLATEGITVCSPSFRGVAEEAPGAYKDVGDVVLASERAGLARRVARLKPVICIKG